jgi:hypothetical protein
VQHRKRAALGVIAIGIVILTVVAHLAANAFSGNAPWTNNDTAFIVYVAQQMDAGARLYVDWLDTDPPSIFLIALAAVRLGRLVHVPALLAYDLLLIAVAMAGVVVLARSIGDLGRPTAAVILAVAAYVFVLIKPGAITRDFAERGHFFALVLIPELFASTSTRRVHWRPAWCAVVAFIAMMKPQFVAIVAVIELTAPREARLRPPDLAGFAIGALAPFAMLWWNAPESLTALFTRALALHLSGAYGFLDESASALVERGPLLVTAAAVVAFGATLVVQHRDGRLRSLSVRAGLALACCWLSVLEQQKYFPYHFIPLFGLAVVCGAWALGEWLTDRRPLFAVAAAALLVSLGLTVFHADLAASTDDTLAVRLSRVTRDDASVMVESVYLHGLCTPFRAAVRCVGPEAQTVTLPQMAWARNSEQQLRAWAATVAARVRARRPDVIALSTGTLAMPDGLSPARLLLERFPIFTSGEYVRLSPSAHRYLDAGYWLFLRRRDVPERPPA